MVYDLDYQFATVFDDSSAAFPDNVLPQLSAHNPPLGDYYGIPEDTFRGLTLNPAELLNDFKTSEQNEHDPLRFCMSSSTFQSSFYDQENKMHASTSTTRFERSELPPDLPEDPLFKLAATTITCSCAPSWVMNTLLHFFETQVTSEVTKVTPAKFAVKLEVFDNISRCSMKVRMYRLQNDEYALEFQRRSGDAITFQKIYQQACLQVEPCSASTATLADAAPLVDSPTGQLSSAAELTPLIDMLSFSDAPKLQAEAAAGLASIVSGDEASAVVACSAPLFDLLANLLQIDSMDVAYPIACLLSSFADCASAKALLASSGLLPAMKEQMVSVHKPTLVTQQLKAAVTTYCQQEW